MGDHGVGSVDTMGNVVGKFFFLSPTSLIAKSPIIISVTFIGQLEGRFLLFPFLITFKACGSETESVFLPWRVLHALVWQ